MATDPNIVAITIIAGSVVLLIGAGFLALDIFQLSFFQDFNKGIGGRK